jgi:hypothetical protein
MKLPPLHKLRMIFPVALMHLLKILAYPLIMLFLDLAIVCPATTADSFLLPPA